jgi:hypothetical protein
MRWGRVAALAVTVALVCAAAVHAAPPSGNAKGLALLARMHTAYRSVPAVAISLRLGTTSFDSTVVLRSGLVVGEQLVVRTPTGTTTMVARGRGPTFSRSAGASCWRRLSRKDKLAFDDLGLRFPDEPGLRVEAPRSTATAWLLDVISNGQPATYVVDKKSHRIRSVTVRSNGGVLTESVRSLGSAPKLAVPSRLC